MNTKVLQESFFSHILAITNRHLSKRPYVEQIERICARQPWALLVREKDLLEDEYARLLMQVKNICDAYKVRCIAHTYVKAALRCDVTDIHVPLSLGKAAAEQKGRFREIGVSVHSVEEALQAEREGASYLTAGHIFATACKPGLAPRGKEFLREVCATVHIPVYAIGGMRVSKACVEEMKACGAAGIGVMSACMRW